jgi:NADH-quinone oxidoreductase subunit J
MEAAVFIVAAVVVLAGALGVVLGANPVHCALSLVLTLFGIAVLFVAQDANFLAAVQVIVYAGAIVVLFLFVIMLLGIDRAENLQIEPLKVQRPAAAALGLAAIGLILATLFLAGGRRITGVRSASIPLGSGEPDINTLARSLFSDYVFAFEVTSLLLVVAVIATVMLGRRPSRAERHAVRREDDAEKMERR